MANAVATRQKTGITTYLSNEAVKKNIMSVIGEKGTQKFISSVVSAVQANPALAECSNSSILSAALLGESLNLTPSPQMGQFYLVPYQDKERGSQAQFQIGYKGSEEFTLKPILDMKTRESLPTVGYYAMFELTNGFRKELYWSREQMESHARRYSRGYARDLQKHTAYTFWSKDFSGMAKKTLLRQLISKWGIMSIEMEKGFAGDMGVINEDGTVVYIDNKVTAEDVIESHQDEVAENANTVDIEVEGDFT